jgi:hypothetical protein
MVQQPLTGQVSDSPCSHVGLPRRTSRGRARERSYGDSAPDDRRGNGTPNEIHFGDAGGQRSLCFCLVIAAIGDDGAVESRAERFGWMRNVSGSGRQIASVRLHYMEIADLHNIRGAHNIAEGRQHTTRR